jgi:hypothetical protein
VGAGVKERRNLGFLNPNYFLEAAYKINGNVVISKTQLTSCAHGFGDIFRKASESAGVSLYMRIAGRCLKPAFVYDC